MKNPAALVQRGSRLGRKKRGRKETDDTDHGSRLSCLYGYHTGSFCRIGEESLDLSV